MTITRIRLRAFRAYRAADSPVGAGITVVYGANGAGKTNLLEALYFGCTGRSFRTNTDREVIHFESDAARVEVDVLAADGPHEIAVGIAAGEKVLEVDGGRVERLHDHPARPLMSVFAPDRLELVKGAPALRRSHLDQVVSALWPSRAATRRAYAAALAQRNALIARARHGAPPSSLDAWDLELAQQGVALIQDRSAAATLVAGEFPDIAHELGLAGVAELRYRPRSSAGSADELVSELRERRESDLARGFTQHGPHRDDVALLRDGRELRAYGSQGEQRLGLLAMLLAEREVLESERGTAPVLLLDDVMSELDEARRARLAARLSTGGQALITTTELAHVPSVEGVEMSCVAVRDGSIVAERPVIAA